MDVLVRSAVLGLAAGGRASVGAAVPGIVATRGWPGRDGAVVRAAVRLGVLGELVGDKLPTTPSRLDSPGVLGRLLSGALGAGWLAHLERREPAEQVLAGLVGGAGAFVGSVVGAAWRQVAARPSGPALLHPDWHAAVAEDVVVLAAAKALVSTSR